MPPTRPNQARRRAAAVVAALGVLSGCASGHRGSGATTAAPTTTADPAVAAAAATRAAWQEDAQMYRGKDGATIDYDCPPGGSPGDIWGVETYTDNSSVCTAAVHVGLITFDGGGRVTIEIGPGQDSYEAGIAHQVESKRYDAWDGSFTFPASPPGSHSFQTPPDSWTVTLHDLRLDGGAIATLSCSPNGTVGKVWGSDIYSDRSSICTAAAFEGRLTTGGGGRVTIEAIAGQGAYQGSQANGITTLDHGRAPQSFHFVDPATTTTTTTVAGG